MPNRTIYVKQSDQDLWSAIEEFAKQEKRSVSDVIAQGMRLVVDKYGPAPLPDEPNR